MMLGGQIIGHGVTKTPEGFPVYYTLVEPSKSVENLTIMGRESKRWHQTADNFTKLAMQHQGNVEVVRRAQFTDNVLAAAAENTRLGIPPLVAQSEDGRILGVMVFNMVSPTEGAINLLAIDPSHLLGAPGQKPLRGIGTAMTSVIARKFLREGVSTVFLHPLDPKAAMFWSNRGFSVCGGGGLLCVRGQKGIEEMAKVCDSRPEDGRDFFLCGSVDRTEAFTTPRVAPVWKDR